MPKNAGDIIYAPGEPYIQVFETSDTWSKIDSVRAILIRCVGGGGSGGGCEATGVGEAAEGGGGGGGGYTEKLLLAELVPTFANITVGAGGAGASSGSDGNDGGTSEFVGIVSATGGRGGRVGTAGPGAIRRAGGRGGEGFNGDLNIDGSYGGTGLVVANGQNMKTGNGGASPFGGIISSAAEISNGLTGQDYGGGSTGASSNAGDAARGSAAGADGVVIVISYF